MFGVFCRARETRKGRPNEVAVLGRSRFGRYDPAPLDTPVPSFPAGAGTEPGRQPQRRISPQAPGKAPANAENRAL